MNSAQSLTGPTVSTSATSSPGSRSAPRRATKPCSGSLKWQTPEVPRPVVEAAASGAPGKQDGRTLLPQEELLRDLLPCNFRHPGQQIPSRFAAVQIGR